MWLYISSMPWAEYFPKNLMSTLSEFWYWRLLAERRLPAFIYQQLGFLAYAWKLWNKGKGLQLVDHEVLDDSYFLLEVMKYVHIELLYVQNNATDRPTMHDGYSVDAK